MKISRTNKLKHLNQDKIFTVVNYVLMTVILVIVSYPIILVISSSISNPEAVMQGKVKFLPVGFSLEGYIAVFKDQMIMIGYMNSLYYLIVGTVINLFMTILAAYPLSRKDLNGRRFILFTFSFTMLFGGGLIPTFLLINQLGLYDTRWAILIPSAMSVYQVIVMRTYFQTTIPIELQESAKMDGCSDIKFLMKIVMPLSGPIIAVTALFYGVGNWNSYFSALIYLNNKDYYPLQLILRQILVLNDVSFEMLAQDPEAMQVKLKLIELIKYAVIIVANLPLIIAYPFAQKYFVKGIMIGSLKG